MISIVKFRKSTPTACCLAFLVPLEVIALVPLSGEGIPVQDCVVRFAQEIEIPALASGRVAEVTVQTNDAVEAGAPLARLDDRSLLIRRRAAALACELAQSDASDDVEQQYAEAAFKEATAELDASRSIHHDVNGAISANQLRRMRLAVERAVLEVARAKKRQQQSRLETRMREADLAMIDEQLNNLKSISSIAGVVLNVSRSVGEWIEAGETIATVASMDRLRVHALASSHDISASACRDATATVHWKDPATGKARSLRGRVVSIDPQILPGGRYRLHAEVINRVEPDDERQWQLKPGASVEMRIHPSTTVAARVSPFDSRN